MDIKILIRRLQEAGWALDRVRGSHHVFVHKHAVRSVVVPVHGREIPDFYARNILKQARQAIEKGQ